MEPSDHDAPPRSDAGSSSAPSRRRALTLGLASAGVAWVAPAVLSVDAASAATDPPPPVAGSLTGEVTRCGHGLDPGESYLVTATQNPGGAVGSDTTTAAGMYLISGLPAGTYDVVLHPNGNNTGWVDQSFPAAAVVPAGGTAVFNPDYTANGC